MQKWNYSSTILNNLSNTDKKSTSIHRAANILICLSNGINTITDIAKSCKLSKSTVHRLLKILEESYLVTKDPINHRYYLGHLITQLALNPKTTHEYLITCAIEEMKRLSDVSEETVVLSIMVGMQYVWLHQIMSKHVLRVTADINTAVLLFVGATAKVLLSQLNDKELQVVMKNIKIERVTEHTVTDKNILIEQLKTIRQQGYAISYGERIVGAVGISAPIRNYVCPAALSIMVPQSRLEKRETDLITELKVSASRIPSNIRQTLQPREVNYVNVRREKQSI